MEIEYKEKAWLILQALQDFGPQRREQIVGDDSIAAQEFRNLMSHRLIRRVDDHVVEISTRGKSVLRAVTLSAQEYLGEVAGARTHQGSGNYEGKELGKTCHRPGAYDAYSLPSLFAGKRVTRGFA